MKINLKGHIAYLFYIPIYIILSSNSSLAKYHHIQPLLVESTQQEKDERATKTENTSALTKDSGIAYKLQSSPVVELSPNSNHQIISDSKTASVKIECLSLDVNACNKLFKDDTSNLFTLRDLLLGLALVVSIGGFLYNFRKDSKTRLWSINDEFWIRKIVSPVTIEPLIKDILEITANLPNDCSYPNMVVDTHEQFIKNYHPKIQQLFTNLQALKLLDNSMYFSFHKGLTSIEDITLDYCGINTNQIKNGITIPTNSKNETNDKVIEQMLLILKALKTYQTKSL